MCDVLFERSLNPIQVSTLEMAEAEEGNVGRKNLCLEMKMLHAIHMAVNGTKLGIIQVT